MGPGHPAKVIGGSQIKQGDAKMWKAKMFVCLKIIYSRSLVS